MIPLILAASVAVLLGLPLILLPAWPIALAGVAAAALYAIGVLTRTSGPTGVAGGIMLINYAAVLWLESAPMQIESAVVFGLALFLASDAAAFLQRARGARVFGSAVAHRFRFYIRQMLATTAAAIILMLAANLASGALPGRWRAILLGIGAVLALLGILRGYGARTRSSHAGR